MKTIPLCAGEIAPSKHVDPYADVTEVNQAKKDSSWGRDWNYDSNEVPKDPSLPNAGPIFSEDNNFVRPYLIPTQYMNTPFEDDAMKRGGISIVSMSATRTVKLSNGTDITYNLRGNQIYAIAFKTAQTAEDSDLFLCLTPQNGMWIVDRGRSVWESRPKVGVGKEKLEETEKLILSNIPEEFKGEAKGVNVPLSLKEVKPRKETPLPESEPSGPPPGIEERRLLDREPSAVKLDSLFTKLPFKEGKYITDKKSFLEWVKTQGIDPHFFVSHPHGYSKGFGYNSSDDRTTLKVTKE